jgi:drug/metabolite transporter (DMT)-like permease
MNKIDVRIILCYLGIYVIWGSTYLAIKWGVESIPPFYLVSFRFFIGGIIFIFISVVTGRLRRIPKWQEILSAVFMGTFLLLLGNGLVSWAEQKVDSYLAALIMASTPFCIAFFNWIFFREKLSKIRLFGMILGVAGVGLIFYNGNSSFHFDFHLGLLVAGFIFWGFATSVGHKLKVHPNNLVHSGMQMLYVGIAAFILSHILYGPLPQIISGISERSWMGLAYLAFFGGIGFYAYNYLLSNEPAIRISSYAIINPLIAVILGIFLENEKPLIMLYVGMPIILFGLAFMMYGETIISIFKKRTIMSAMKEDEEFDEKITEE